MICRAVISCPPVSRLLSCRHSWRFSPCAVMWGGAVSTSAALFLWLPQAIAPRNTKTYVTVSRISSQAKNDESHPQKA
jgi:hypothetical protein